MTTIGTESVRVDVVMDSVDEELVEHSPLERGADVEADVGDSMLGLKFERM